MGYVGKWGNEPNGSPEVNLERRGEENWGEFDRSSSVNAISFGFVATAILISMFLIMAIFERFLRPTFPHFPFHPYPSPKIVYSEDVSVLMPGEDIPTFIAQPVPLQCPPDRIQWPTPPKTSLNSNQ